MKKVTPVLLAVMIIWFTGLSVASPDPYPEDPATDRPWSSQQAAGVAAVELEFNAARELEEKELEISLPVLQLPSQSEWDRLSDAEKALWLINQERKDRGIAPLHGLEPRVMAVAQSYADYLLKQETFAHDAGGQDPLERLNEQPAIRDCHDFLRIGENLAVEVSQGSLISLVIEKAIYGWMYNDGKCCDWAHRHTLLWTDYTENSGPPDREGFMGLGRATGGPFEGPFSDEWEFAEMIVMNVFDPCPDWNYTLGLEELVTILMILTGHFVHPVEADAADANWDGRVDLADLVLALRQMADRAP